MESKPTPHAEKPPQSTRESALAAPNVSLWSWSTSPADTAGRRSLVSRIDDSAAEHAHRDRLGSPAPSGLLTTGASRDRTGSAPHRVLATRNGDGSWTGGSSKDESALIAIGQPPRSTMFYHWFGEARTTRETSHHPANRATAASQGGPSSNGAQDTVSAQCADLRSTDQRSGSATTAAVSTRPSRTSTCSARTRVEKQRTGQQRNRSPSQRNIVSVPSAVP